MEHLLVMEQLLIVIRQNVLYQEINEGYYYHQVEVLEHVVFYLMDNNNHLKK